MKIFILFALVRISVCRDNDNYESPPVNCVAYGSSSGQGQNSHSSGQGQNSHSSGQGSGSFSSSSSSFSSSSSSFSSSSSYEYTKCDSPYNNQDYGKPTCMKRALQNVPALAQGANRLLCHLKNDQNNQDTENYNNVTRELRAIVRCAGCKLDDVLGTGETLENLTEQIAKMLDPLLFSVVSAVQKLPVVGDIVCTVSETLGDLVTGGGGGDGGGKGGLLGGGGGGLLGAGGGGLLSDGGGLGGLLGGIGRR